MDPTWFESHCHLDSLADPAGAIARAAEVGVHQMVAIGDDLPSSRACIALAEQYEGVYATAGIHPHHADFHADQWEGILDCHRSDRVLAVGETGLDYFYEHSQRDAQLHNFRAHIELAGLLRRPLVIHVRDAWEDFWSVLEETPLPVPAVIHCFTGGPEEVARGAAHDLYFGISGIVTFPKAESLRVAILEIPSDRLLVETDAPFLAPVPHRGKQNEPAFVPFVGASIAALRGELVESTARQTRENAERLFGISQEER